MCRSLATARTCNCESACRTQLSRPSGAFREGPLSRHPAYMFNGPFRCLAAAITLAFSTGCMRHEVPSCFGDRAIFLCTPQGEFKERIRSP
jgi:hypothetical protein